MNRQQWIIIQHLNMTACNGRMWSGAVFLLWMWMLDASCETQDQAEEGENSAALHSAWKKKFLL